jgi:hypothetical protein
MGEAGRALNIDYTRIVKYFANNQQKPYKGQYTFKKKKSHRKVIFIYFPCGTL